MDSSPQSLHGKRIMITRSLEQSGETAALIVERDGVPVLFPCLEVETLIASIQACDDALQHATDILFTSRNGVACVASVLGETFQSRMADKRVAVVGPRTAQAVRELGIEPFLIPEMSSQEGLIAAYLQYGLPKHLLFFRAEEGSDILQDALQAHGCEVSTIPTYRTICPSQDADGMRQQLQHNDINAVLLGSAKTAQYYLQRIANTELANRPVIAVISDQVAQAATEIGLNVQIVAKTASFEAMLDGLTVHFDKTTVIQE